MSKYGDTPLNLAAFHASAAAAAQAAAEDAGNGKFNSDRSSYDPLEIIKHFLSIKLSRWMFQTTMDVRHYMLPYRASQRKCNYG